MQLSAKVSLKWLEPTVAAAGALLVLSQPAQAHPGHGPHGLGDGVWHIVNGVDHLLAALAVGLLAAQVGGRPLWSLPVTFLAVMAAGGLIPLLGGELPLVEPALLASVLVLGVLIVAAVKLPPAWVPWLVGLFALYHGYAHASEMAAGQSAGEAAGYAAGFVLTTAACHAAGLLVGMRMKVLSPSRVALRLSGGAIAACGVLLMLGRM
jgi:urease accessory protein